MAQISTGKEYYQTDFDTYCCLSINATSKSFQLFWLILKLVFKIKLENNWTVVTLAGLDTQQNLFGKCLKSGVAYMYDYTGSIFIQGSAHSAWI